MSFLRDVAREFFESKYANPTMHVGEELHRDLWTPALRFTIDDYINVFVEPSVTGPYPMILDLKYAEVRKFTQPISIYVVCPSEMLSTSEQRREMNRLQDNGFGLVTIDADNHANQLFSAIPLVQVISEAEFKEKSNELSKKLKQRVSVAFDTYKSNPVSGVQDITMIVEGLVIQAGQDAAKKDYISNNDTKKTIANLLDKLFEVEELSGARAGIGGVRDYISNVRNPNHHWPKNKKRAYRKYAYCRDNFLEGINKINRFSTAMKNVGLTGKLPRI